MANKIPDGLGLIEKMSFRLLQNLRKENLYLQDDYHILNENELKIIRLQIRKSVIWSALLGALGVIFLYVPQYIFPDLFLNTQISIPFSDISFSFPLVSSVYGFILVYPEIYGLMYVNMKAVYTIAKVCGFPHHTDPDFDTHLETLMRIGLEKEDKFKSNLGLNPLQGVSKTNLFLIFLWTKLRATMSNILVRVLVTKVMGRNYLRYVADMFGIPVFAFWNAWSSYKIILETKVRILAPNLIRNEIKEIRLKYGHLPGFKDKLYDVLQFISMTKKAYHYNHYFLAKTILTEFEIPIKDAHVLESDFLELLKNETNEFREGILRILLLGFVIDGDLSRKEKNAIDTMYKNNYINFNGTKVRELIANFKSGKGIQI